MQVTNAKLISTNSQFLHVSVHPPAQHAHTWSCLQKSNDVEMLRPQPPDFNIAQCADCQVEIPPGC